jgi:AcrR family transcriptional regulator
MSKCVKPARSYVSPARNRQRAATRTMIVAAATTCFVEGGYTSTTIPTIARAAGVSTETIYSVFGARRGTKRELLRAVIEMAVTGGTDPSPVITDDWVERIRTEPDQRRRLDLLTAATRDVLRRAASIDEMVRAVATADPEIAQLRRELERRRLLDAQLVVRLLAEAGPLRVPPNEAADLVWALSRSSDLYSALTVDRRWSDRRARAALADILARVLLPDTACRAV